VKGSFVPKTNHIHWAWVILGTCFANLFINYSVRLGYGVILPEMIRDLGLSRTAGGSIFNAYLFPYIALTPITGYLTDRFGARRVITICAFFLGVSVFLMGTVESLWMACLFYAMVGIGATGMWTPIITLVQRWFAPKRRGLGLGVLSTGYGLGFAVMGIAFPWIVNHYSWRYSWYLLGAGALFMVAVNGLLLKSDPESAGYLPWGQKESTVSMPWSTTTLARKEQLIAVFKDRTFWLIGLSYACISYSLYGITTFMVDYAKYQIGLPLEKASLLATVHGVCQVVGVLTILPLSDHLGRKKTIILSNTFISACLAGILLVGNSWVMVCLLVGIMALFYGVTWPIYGACAADYFPKDLMGTVIGALTPLYGLGAILVHWVSGVLRDSTGRYDHAFMLNTITAVMAILFIRAIRER